MDMEKKKAFNLKHMYFNLIIGQRPYIPSQSNLENMHLK